MPWTFAHPAAVLPLRRLGPLRLNLAALAIGSLTPDFGYYVFRLQGSAFAHSFTGSLTVCLAVGLVLLTCCCVLRRPVCYMLPQPHRDALMPLADARWRLDKPTVAVAVVSIVVGAWTHILWDSFTHVDRWFVDHIAWLRLQVMSIRGHVLYGYSLLQHLSSVLGGCLLLWYYWSWLRGANRNRSWRLIERADAWRYACILGAAALAVLVAVPWAFKAAVGADGLFWLRVFVVRSIVGSTSIFGACFVLTAVICYSRRPRAP